MEKSCFKNLSAAAICGTVPQGAIIVCPHVVTTPTGKVGALMRWSATGGYFIRIAGVNISCPQDWAKSIDDAD